MTYIKKYERELLYKYRHMTRAAIATAVKDHAAELLSADTSIAEVARTCNVSRMTINRWKKDIDFASKIKTNEMETRTEVKKDFDKIYIKLKDTLEKVCEDKDNKSLGKIAELVLKVKGVLTPDNSGNSFIFNSTDRVGKMLEMYAYMVNEYSLMNESERQRFLTAKGKAADVL